MSSNRSEQQPPPDLEISWRTRELGPEARRRLFEQVLPSRRPAAVGKDATPAREPTQRERPRRPGTTDR